MNYAEHRSQHLRITLLRLLAEQPAYKANASLLRDAADAVGLAATRDQVATELTWLAEQGHLHTITLENGLIVATLTERGHDVALGRAMAPGVKKPGP